MGNETVGVHGGIRWQWRAQGGAHLYTLNSDLWQ